MRLGAPTLVLAWAVALAAAARAQAPEVAVSAVSEYAAIRPGAPFRVAVRVQLPAGWHIGWINPGAGGLATTIAWHLPAGVSGGATDWPYPETEDAGADVSNVYRGTVVLFSSFAAEPGVTGSIKLSGELSWGMCRVVCIQQHHSVTLDVPVARGAPLRTAAWAEAEAATRLIPMQEPGAAFDATRHDDGVRLVITGLKAGPAPGSWATFFPLEPGKRSVVAPVRAVVDGIALVLPLSVVSDSSARLRGVLVAAHAAGAPPPVRAIAVDTPLPH